MIWLKTIIHNIDRDVRVIGVHAKKGKVARAEPVVGLYERGFVHHVGKLPKLEDEQTCWDSRQSLESPGRIDALVYVVTDLLCAKKRSFTLK